MTSTDPTTTARIWDTAFGAALDAYTRNRAAGIVSTVPVWSAVLATNLTIDEARSTTAREAVAAAANEAVFRSELDALLDAAGIATA